MENAIAALEKKLAAAQAKSLEWAFRRGALPAGSSRARVTTANANWARAAEYRDRIADLLDKARAAQPVAAESQRVDISVGSTITLGRQIYTVYSVGKFSVELTGKRGGQYSLTQNLKNPALWGLCNASGSRSEWYRRTESGEFQAY